MTKFPPIAQVLPVRSNTPDPEICPPASKDMIPLVELKIPLLEVNEPDNLKSASPVLTPSVELSKVRLDEISTSVLADPKISLRSLRFSCLKIIPESLVNVILLNKSRVAKELFISPPLFK